MLVSANEMRRYAVHARGETVGRVHGFHFEEDWGIEHLVAVAGGLLFNRLVLVGVEHLRGADPAERAVRVDLAREQVRDGPSAVRTPLSTDGRGTGFRAGPTSTHQGGSPRENAGPGGTGCAPRPRSTGEVAGYRVRASDGEGGRVEDFVLDVEGWRIRHVVIGLSGRYQAKKALLDPRWIERIAPEARAVHVGLTREQIWGTRRYAGYEVRDPRGTRIGRVKELAANADAQPQYVRVSMDFRAGFLRPRTVLIPAQMLTVDEIGRVLTLQ